MNKAHMEIYFRFVGCNRICYLISKHFSNIASVFSIYPKGEIGYVIRSQNKPRPSYHQQSPPLNHISSKGIGYPMVPAKPPLNHTSTVEYGTMIPAEPHWILHQRWDIPWYHDISLSYTTNLSFEKLAWECRRHPAGWIIRITAAFFKLYIVDMVVSFAAGFKSTQRIYLSCKISTNS